MNTPNFSDIYTLYFEDVYKYASRISGQADKEAEDFITETLLKALFKFRFSRVSPPDTTE